MNSISSKMIDKRDGNYSIWVFIFVSFLLWMVSVREFLFAELPLIGDAKIYYEHIKFYLDHIREGIYPFWEMNRNFGTPTEFFMRRIGEFNPFYFVILILDGMGFSYTQAYLLSMAAYCFVGLSGFYLLAKHVFKSELMGFAAYLLLLFSSLGLRIFDSYLILLFVPYMWFFLFLVRFSSVPQRSSLLGITFCLMIIFTTYVPFYFVVLLGSFLLAFLIAYYQAVPNIAIEYYRFIRKNAVFCTVCFLLIAVSILPGVFLYLEGFKESISLPMRHSETSLPNVFGVSIRRNWDGGIIPPLVWNNLFSDLTNLRLSTFYFSSVGIVFFFLGSFLKLNRRIILFAVWILFLMLIGITNASPVYDFMYKHILVFKYMRNMQFLLWIGILPAFILLIVEHLRLFLAKKEFNRNQKFVWIIFLTMIHFLPLLFYMRAKESMLLTTYVSLGLSYLFLIFFVLSGARTRLIAPPSGFHKTVLSLILFCIISPQTIEALAHIGSHYQRANDDFVYRYNNTNYMRLRLPKKSVNKGAMLPISYEEYMSDPSQERRGKTLYMGARYFVYLRAQMDLKILRFYLRKKFLAYDKYIYMRENEIDPERIEEAFFNNENLAFVSLQKGTPPPPELSQISILQHPYIHTGNSDQMEVLDYGSNFVRIKTNFNNDKFLVYNDNYHRNWWAKINNKAARLYRSNISFKGLFVPKGENIVRLQYGAPWRYCFKYFMVGLYVMVFLALLFLNYKKPGENGGISNE